MLLRNVRVYLPVQQTCIFSNADVKSCYLTQCFFFEDRSDPCTSIMLLAIRTHCHISGRLPVPDQNVRGVSLFNVDFNVVTVLQLHVLRQLTPSVGTVLRFIAYCLLYTKKLHTVYCILCIVYCVYASRSVIFVMLIICSVCIVMFHYVILIFMYLCL